MTETGVAKDLLVDLHFRKSESKAREQDAILSCPHRKRSAALSMPGRTRAGSLKLLVCRAEESPVQQHECEVHVLFSVYRDSDSSESATSSDGTDDVWEFQSACMGLLRIPESSSFGAVRPHRR